MKKLIGYVAFLTTLICFIACTSTNKESGEDVVKISPEFTDSVHRYDALFPFSEGLAAVRKDDKFGFINTKGAEVIPCKFNYVGPFKDGLAFAFTEGDDNVTFINKNGEVFKTKYPLDASYYLGQMKNGYFDDSMLTFNNGVCEINYSTEQNGEFKTVYIDKEFNEVVTPSVSISDNEEAEYVIFTETAKDIYNDDVELKGVKDKSGKIVVPAKYNNIMLGENGVAAAVLFVEDAESHLHPYRPYGMELYGYIDFAGNSTFTEADKGKLEGYGAAQKEAYAILKDQEEQQEDLLSLSSTENYSQGESSSTVKEVYIEYTSEYGYIVSNNGNYGCNEDDFVGLISNMITIPDGKKWVLKGVNQNMDDRILTYSAYRGDGKLYRDRTIEVSKNTRETYTFYGGDHIRVAIRPIKNSNVRSDRVIFTFIEKSEYD